MMRPSAQVLRHVFWVSEYASERLLVILFNNPGAAPRTYASGLEFKFLDGLLMTYPGA